MPPLLMARDVMGIYEWRLKMEWKPVDSSMIRSIAYDLDARQLAIEFQSGAIYYYWDVPEGVHRGIMLASSKGAYFLETVRDQFICERIG